MIQRHEPFKRIVQNVWFFLAHTTSTRQINTDSQKTQKETYAPPPPMVRFWDCCWVCCWAVRHIRFPAWERRKAEDLENILDLSASKQSNKTDTHNPRWILFDDCFCLLLLVELVRSLLCHRRGDGRKGDFRRFLSRNVAQFGTKYRWCLRMSHKIGLRFN